MKSHPALRILVVDDDTTVRESLRLYLEDLDHTVLEAADGREGLEQFRRESPDLALIDLRMPVLDGLRVLEQLTRDAPETPLIVISGTGRIGDTVEALRLGAWDYILKPIDDLSILDHAIAKAMERAQLLRENKKHRQHLEEEVERRTRELTEKMEEMTRFNHMAVDREKRIIELKRLVNSLLSELGREPRFKSPDMLEPNPSLLD